MVHETSLTKRKPSCCPDPTEGWAIDDISDLFDNDRRAYRKLRDRWSAWRDTHTPYYEWEHYA